MDDQMLTDCWQHHVANYSADISLMQSYHRVRLEYYKGGGSAAVSMSWAALQ